ncbi:hypothetical protein NIES2119_06330 [[Phormidium ambiguum] IAM M-71]|uniref:Uncharacterized protein n=1 Tax=[Phormidium ambiguum] IAM M-71 TaxID=454136 RepID=A0A1U7IPV3_9CYAN|nr:hypothetical protein [Phormidium ambiguum]OKH39354.1 hypothetical protein NIES2119_06330 [Phormidium ambiguum IAM M-71]
MFNKHSNKSASKSSLKDVPGNEMMVELTDNDEESLSGGAELIATTPSRFGLLLAKPTALVLLFANPFA